MPNRVYFVGIRWVDTPINAALIDGLLNSIGDWIRYNGMTWFLSTEKSAGEIYEILRHHLKVGDSTVVVAMDPSDYQGWAATWIWDWFADKNKKSRTT
jgi:hypothetical protein